MHPMSRNQNRLGAMRPTGPLTLLLPPALPIPPASIGGGPKGTTLASFSQLSPVGARPHLVTTPPASQGTYQAEEVETKSSAVLSPFPNKEASSPSQSYIQPPGPPAGGGRDPRPTSDKTGSSAEDFRVHIVTWNVGSAMPPDDIKSLLGLNAANGRADMYIIGLQEMNSMINKRLKDALFTDQWSDLCMDTLSGSGYVLVTSQRMQGVLLLVFARYHHMPFLRGIQTESTRTGLGGYWGNKGGVSARMTVFGHSICFLNCHLPAHMENTEQRMEDFETILQQQQFQGGGVMGVLDHELVFWFGDLNFRIEDYDVHVVKSAIESNMLSLLWGKDQLNMAKDYEPLLKGFMEGPLNFPPTYKFDVGTHIYDTSAKKRKPAWTDRILWRLRETGSSGPSLMATVQRGLTSWLSHGMRVTQHAYRSHVGYTVSDHKPVSAIFSLQFPYRVDVPLVTLSVDAEWTKFSDATVKFKVAPAFSRSSWDWIGLYKVGFRHQKDYVAYVWARQEECDHVAQEHQVTFSEEDLPKGSGEYILGYFSNNTNTIVGLTEPIQDQRSPVMSPQHLQSSSKSRPALPSSQIELPSPSPKASPLCSSDSSSEDDSTLVLLQPKARSPSPSSAKQRRSGRSPSPALPKLQGLNLRPHSRDRVNRSTSPCASSSSSSTAKRERLVSPESPPSPSNGPARTRTPGTPGIEVSTPEALIAAIIGEHIPPQGLRIGVKPAGEPGDARL